MRLVITDTGTIWNKDNAFLEKYKDIVLVVCLNGKKVTDKYECFVSPFESDAFPEADSCEARNCRLEMLASEASRLIDEFSYIAEVFDYIQPYNMMPKYEADCLDNLDKGLRDLLERDMYWLPDRR